MTQNVTHIYNFFLKKELRRKGWVISRLSSVYEDIWEGFYKMERGLRQNGEEDKILEQQTSNI